MGPGGETDTLSVAGALAAVAHCPVVAVPDSWRMETPVLGAIIVGIEHPGRDGALLAAARHEADRRQARLVEVQVEDGRAAAGLLERAATADLLVVGRHNRTHVVGAPLGRTSRELLRRSPVPVLVIDPAGGDAPSPTSIAATSRR
jgi:hypothetical protein